MNENMTYLSQAKLGENMDFGRRSRSAITNQSTIFMSDERADIKALADCLLTGSDPAAMNTFLNMIASSPGFADSVDPDGDGTVDSSLVTDADLLASVQANFPTVASLYFDVDGTPKT